MNILVLNAGSSSLKYTIYDVNRRRPLLTGMVEHIEEKVPVLNSWQKFDQQKQSEKLESGDFKFAFEQVFGKVGKAFVVNAIGHRVVHGGAEFNKIIKITPSILQQLYETIPLAPLHNPANIKGIELAMNIFSGVEQYAVFDTAFHCTIPQHAYSYALPLSVSNQYNIRRYGFHGISHSHIAKVVAKQMSKQLDKLNLISLHLGNGASVAAISQGRCVDTSMGMTPMEGLIMGTRSGDLDPGILLFLLRHGYDEASLSELLNHQSGLKGLCGNNDMREICALAEQGNASAQLAIKMYCYRIKKYIGAYSAVLGQVDALAFSGGVGENSSFIRATICEGLESLGIVLDANNNQQVQGDVVSLHKDKSSIAVFKIKSDEELEIAMQVQQLLSE